MKRLVVIMWNSYLPLLVEAAKKISEFDLVLFSSKKIENDPALLEKALSEAEKAGAVVLYRSSEGFWEEVEDRFKTLGQKIPVVWVSHDPTFWRLSSVETEIPATAYQYIVYGGEENFVNLLKYLGQRLLGLPLDPLPPKKMPWEGLYHPKAPSVFECVEDYLAWYRDYRGLMRPMVGILFSRHYWVNQNLEVEDTLIEELETQGLNVLPAFSYSLKDEGLGTKGSAEVVKEVFLDQEGRPRIEALVKLQPFFLGCVTTRNLSDTKVAASGVELLKKLGVPVFQPVTSYYKSIEEWETDTQGLSHDIGWAVALPEFEGVIEPFFLGAVKRAEDKATEVTVERRVPVRERCRRLAERISRWIRLRQKPPEERKIVLVLHNNPCASVEATVGAGAHLDTLESVARIMTRLKEVGYTVEGAPKNGRELIQAILERKAISEFRWTTVEEIVRKGGALALVPLEQYLCWWKEFPEKVRKRVRETWGDPPGQEVNGVPTAMVYQGKIVVTGLKFGHIVVCVQPKRGCAGPRCDGRVCKILHDPDIPPPHQYLATYRYLEEVFGADVIVHVGTHGNLEFLPGKGVGLSEACLPDLVIHQVPHLYIYNADNPPEGIIAKRRSYAVLVDHMQTVMTESGLYDDLEELARYLGEYEQAKLGDQGRAHALEHLILDLIQKTNLDKEIRLSPDLSFDEITRRVHEALSRIRNTQIQDGMHIFGEIPRGERRVEFIKAILRYEADGGLSLRRLVAQKMGLDLSELLKDQGSFDPIHQKSHGELLEEIEKKSKELVAQVLKGQNSSNNPDFLRLSERILDLDRRIEASQEIEALLAGIEGKYLEPGPSGLITRGRDDVLPTGRNFYALDPHRVPTPAAYQVGRRLASALLEKYLTEEGHYPENVAVYWMCTDIMWSDGEGMGKIFALLGVRPVWAPNGRVKGLEVIPLSELGRPRIDVTIRVSGITRDNFPNCVELIDEAIQMVATLDEPLEMNFVRKHTLEKLEKLKTRFSREEALRRATFRLFASKPGTYMAGVNLAVYASAWKEEKDLAEVFLYWNGYAYGRGVFGEKAYTELAESLETVDVTFNKVVTDEYDLFGCCCYFGTHGGLTVAARHFSQNKVRAYYGDTREPERIEVRDLADEVRRVVRTKLLNPRWIEGMKRHGYKGAGEIAKRIGRVYGWEATTQEVDDWIFDEIARTFVLNEENRRFFKAHNPWALEEIARRLLEAEARGLWQADSQTLTGLRQIYAEIEGWLEDKMGEVSGDFQGGAVDILTAEDIETWQTMLQEMPKEVFISKR